MRDGEICESVTQQAVQASPATPNVATAAAQTDFQCQEHCKLPTKNPQSNSSSNNNNNSNSNNNKNKPPPDVQRVSQWQLDEVQQWFASTQHLSLPLLDCLRHEAIDGQVLLTLTEADVRDMRYKLGYKLTFGELKKFWLTVSQLQQQEHHPNGRPNSPATNNTVPMVLGTSGQMAQASLAMGGNAFIPLVMSTDPCHCPPVPECPSNASDCETLRHSDKRLVAPEYFKTAISLGYSFLVTWITSFVMVIVHERVPDMKRYPPLPDIFLDNVPHIPWAFNMCEITGSLLFTVWILVLIFHKYRMVLLRRFFALAGTVFLLRCVTMLITSLSVPGTHLQCNQKDFAIDDPNVDMFEALVIRMTRAYRIWSGLGMSIQGVRTCGDYMFSGHTVALTLLNFFITEYTPRNLYFLHTLTWLLNMFGIFFILAAHEHYSIDVFVAFYITSRLFLYYHTLSNNRALMQSDSTRTRIWFPMFSYFESSVDGIIPNEFDSLGTLISSLFDQIIRIKDQATFIAYYYWSTKAPIPIKSSLRIMSNSEPEAYNHTPSVASNYFSPRQSLVVNNIRPSSPTITANTPQQHKRTTIDASVSSYASVASSEAVKNDSRVPLPEKKLL